MDFNLDAPLPANALVFLDELRRNNDRYVRELQPYITSAVDPYRLQKIMEIQKDIIDYLEKLTREDMA